jgi:hypothetical protein
MQRRIEYLAPHHDQIEAERVAVFMLLALCSGCGRCWLSRLGPRPDKVPAYVRERMYRPHWAGPEGV